mmetsp:Transcript_4515/g.6802  ORF Transcript_4515/g.6802 Transcript_4515/m.6802 type:complete len:125 (+) Transcript_4515:561-935(+)
MNTKLFGQFGKSPHPPAELSKSGLFSTSASTVDSKMSKSTIESSKSFYVSQTARQGATMAIKEECCSLCQNARGDPCWRQSIIEFLDTKSQYVLCLEEVDDGLDASQTEASTLNKKEQVMITGT